MRHFLTLLSLLTITMFGCNKSGDYVTDPDLTNAGPGDVVIKLGTSASVEVSSRAGATTDAEEFEKTLKEVHIVVVERTKNDPAAATDAVVFTYDFPQSAINSQRAIFPLSAAMKNNSDNKTYTFYCIANRALPVTLTTRADVEGAQDGSLIADYNGALVDVTTKAIRSGGFVMSSTSGDVTLAGDAPTKVNLTLRRTVAKVRLTIRPSTLADEGNTAVGNGKSFVSLYGTQAKLRVDKVEIKNYVPTALLFIPTTYTPPSPSVGTALSQATSTEGKNLFYLFNQNGTLDIEIYASFVLNGNIDNTNPTFISIGPYELSIKANSGGTLPFVRNSLYDVQVLLNGLTSNEVSTSIEIEDWQSVGEQIYGIGG